MDRHVGHSLSANRKSPFSQSVNEPTSVVILRIVEPSHIRPATTSPPQGLSPRAKDTTATIEVALLKPIGRRSHSAGYRKKKQAQQTQYNRANE